MLNPIPLSRGGRMADKEPDSKPKKKPAGTSSTGLRTLQEEKKEKK
jgi:hypothetical protein